MVAALCFLSCSITTLERQVVRIGFKNRFCRRYNGGDIFRVVFHLSGHAS